MVVICPNCGREIFSDPDSCVMCGWRRGSPSAQQKQREPGVDYSRERPIKRPPAQRPPPSRYPRDRDQDRFREPYEREDNLRYAQEIDYQEERRRSYPEDERNLQRRPQQDPRIQRGYPKRYPDQRRESYPIPRQQGRYYDDRRGAPPQRYGYDAQRGPVGQRREPGMRESDRNYCPNCGREMFTDPDNCVICGWSKNSQYRGLYNTQEIRRGYPLNREQGYGQDERRGYPQEGWEKKVDERLRGGGEPQPRGERSDYPPQRHGRRARNVGAREIFMCENCGNPSLQFFADGLGRCPGCGYRFRYSNKPTGIKSKHKHKQFICSNCDSKNLQFYLDGTGLCPQCRREFRWSK